MVTSKPCILLVDRDDHALHATARSLRRQPFAVYTARSVAEAVSILSEETILAIACDVGSAVDEDGDLLAWASLHRPQTALVLLTTEQRQSEAHEAVQNGEANAYVVRPCAQKQLARAICSALEWAESRDERDYVLSGGN